MDARPLEDAPLSALRRRHLGRPALVGTAGRWAACVAIVVLALTGCRARPRSGDTNEEPVATAMEALRMDHYRGTILRWRMAAANARILTTQKMRVRLPRVVVYDNGQPTLRLEAEEGEIDQKTYDVRLWGRVRGVARAAMLDTDELLWRDADGKLIAPGAVVMTRGRSVVRGVDMEGYPNLERVTLRGVRFRLHPQDEKRPDYPLPALE
jgi:LPS export ABC transporter protein LptC